VIFSAPVEEVLRPAWISEVVYSVFMLTALAAVSGRRRTFVAGVLLTIPFLVLTWASKITGEEGLTVAAATGGIASIGFTLWITLAHVLRPGPVDLDRLTGALCGYLLTALLWAFLYVVVEELQPGSFRIDGAAPSADATLLYFSLVTITTLGYGDVAPVLPVARSLAVLEAVVGVGFIATLVSRLVGSWQPRRVARRRG